MLHPKERIASMSRPKPLKVRLQTVLLEIAYDGSRFHGLAMQPNVATVAAAVRARIASVFAEDPKALTFAARTDAGVSADQNFATFRIAGPANPERALSRLVEGTLADGLHIKGAQFVPRSVNARSSALGKSYRYEIQDATRNPNPRARPWQIYPRLDEQRMAAAAAHLVGEHDFSAFRAMGCSAKSTVKQLQKVSISRSEDRVQIDFEGNGFLRKMVRILSGTLAEVGAQLRTPEEVATILQSRNRRLAGLTAPARGLTLRRVTLSI